MLNVIDFEVFKKLWTAVIINPITQEETVIENDSKKLEDYYNQHRNEIYIGYNIRGYDQYIFKGILCDMNPYDISKWIIEEKRGGWEYSQMFRKVPLIFYDVMIKLNSLKQLEGFMGNDIRETTIPFDYDGEFTQEMIDEVIYYNRHDVLQTLEVFMHTKSDFDAQLDLIKTFNLPLSYMSKTKAQLTASALGCKKQKHDDEWEISFVPTIKLDRYRRVWNWFRNPNNFKDGNKLEVEVAGIPHTFGLGGIHGAADKPIHRKGLIIHVDVTSYYPSLMIEYDLLSRNVKDKDVFKQVYDKRVALKAAGKKKEQAPYKIILNSTFGITNDVFSKAYDPRRNHEVCINGQLLLLDLIEKLEVIEGFELIQSNTDGLIVMIPDTDRAFDKLDDICFEWEQRTHMGLGFDVISEIYQGDVNNYVFTFEDGKHERKGAYVKELSALDNDLPIINKALVDYMTKKIPVERTIGECKELIMFQKIVRIQGNYLCAWHNGETLADKTFRVFASKDQNDTSICKMKSLDSTKEKFANTPEHCFIDNRDVNNKTIPAKLDRNWYIDLARKRLQEKFGIEQE